MPESGARAWWADVEHLRDDYERTAEARRRADRADLAARRAARERRRAAADVAIDGAPRRRNRGESPQARAPRRAERAAAGQAPERRTIVIRGRPVPAPQAPWRSDGERRRPPRRAVERVGPRPDRLALWALLMCVVLILVAVSTSDAAVHAVIVVR